jgi:hypothetical protein
MAAQVDKPGAGADVCIRIQISDFHFPNFPAQPWATPFVQKEGLATRFCVPKFFEHLGAECVSTA